MIELIASACIIVNGTTYCEVPNQEPPRREMAPIEQQIVTPDQEMTIPIHQLETHTMNDPAYSEVVFNLKSVKQQNDCVNSLLYLLEGRNQVPGQEYCSEMVYGAFGGQFAPQSQTAINIFRMIAHHAWAVQKREFKLPLGLDRRLKAMTGLTTF